MVFSLDLSWIWIWTIIVAWIWKIWICSPLKITKIQYPEQKLDPSYKLIFHVGEMKCIKTVGPVLTVPSERLASRFSRLLYIDLLKLMDTENASSVAAMRADLLPEAGGLADVAHRQRALRQPLVSVQRCYRLFRGCYQVLLIHWCILSYLLAAFTDHLEIITAPIVYSNSSYKTNNLSKYWK